MALEVTMASDVLWADLRVGNDEGLPDRLVRLLDSAGISDVVGAGDLTAVKVHFGEKGGHAFVRPLFLRRIVDRIKQLGGRPFLTDSSTLYPGERKQAVSALTCAVENGFAYSVVGAPLIMCDGLRGHSARRVDPGGELLESVDIGLEVLEADALINVCHFKCHELTGFGGAIKNLGMGCASREGKLEQHSTVAPKVDQEECTGCGSCEESCAHDAISMREGTAWIDDDACTGCARCVTVCEDTAIHIGWNEAPLAVMRKMSEYAKGAIVGKQGKLLHVSFITQVSPTCDCYGHSDAAIVPDLGILVATDPVALDQACIDLVNQAQGLPDTALSSGHEPGGDKLRGVHPKIDWEIGLEHAEKIGLGSRTYNLIRLEAPKKG
jgi:uncharacterized Fe-S center protein